MSKNIFNFSQRQRVRHIRNNRNWKIFLLSQIWALWFYARAVKLSVSHWLVLTVHYLNICHKRQINQLVNTPDGYVSHFFQMCQINPEILHICGNFSRMKLSVCKEQRVTKEKVRQAMKGEVAKTDTKKIMQSYAGVRESTCLIWNNHSRSFLWCRCINNN